MPDMTDKEHEQFEAAHNKYFQPCRSEGFPPPPPGSAFIAGFTAGLAVHAQELTECRALLERCRIDVLIDHPYLRSGSDYTKAWLRDLIAAITEQLKGGK